MSRNNHNYLIDCGEGIRHRLDKVKVDYFDIDAVFLSHFHPDHFNVETLIQSIQVRNFKEKVDKSLTIYGPPETGARIKSIWDAKHFTGAFDKSLAEFVKLDIREYEDEVPLDVHGMKVTPYFLAHGNMPAAALRFEIDNKVFVYSGDTGVNDVIGNAARNANIFLVECNQRPDKSNPGHLNPKEVGEIALKNNVSQVVLTHMPGIDATDVLLNAVHDSGYTGTVHVGRDFDVLQL
jgi:ribonuclease BN (tRNA processing enzyme)